MKSDKEQEDLKKRLEEITEHINTIQIVILENNEVLDEFNEADKAYRVAFRNLLIAAVIWFLCMILQFWNYAFLIMGLVTVVFFFFYFKPRSDKAFERFLVAHQNLKNQIVKNDEMDK